MCVCVFANPLCYSTNTWRTGCVDSSRRVVALGQRTQQYDYPNDELTEADGLTELKWENYGTPNAVNRSRALWNAGHAKPEQNDMGKSLGIVA